MSAECERRALYIHRYRDDPATGDDPLPDGPPCIAPLIEWTEDRVCVPTEQEDAVCTWLALPDVQLDGVWGWYD